MIAEPFAAGDTWLHRLDSRAKLLTAIAFAVVVAGSDAAPVLLAAMGAAIALLIAARPPLRHLLRRLVALNVFIVLLWVMLPLSGVGESLYSLGPLTVRADGVRLAWHISLKANAILLALTALIATSTIFNVAHGLSHLHVPHKLVQLFFFTWRFLHDAALEFQRLRRAMKVRCFVPRSNLHTYRSYAYLVGTLMVRGHDRAARVYDAMVLRGFTGTLPAYRHPHWRRADTAAFIAFMAAVTALGVWEWTSPLGR
ncbi:MAG: cobalt ECF transporter T component CbiQ [Candidatus Lernaella stagnicola]|nr:cobalt ECF transporter T component CbiQ [Candidatus Lernaella stagnicola]